MIKYYHAHLYYGADSIDEARSVAAKAESRFGIKVGRFHEKPVGPHPVWSCQLTVPSKLFADVIPWLSLNRGSIDLFIHPVTGNDLADHTKYVMWLGKSYDLNTDLFQSN